jgi:hypothetical protein
MEKSLPYIDIESFWSWLNNNVNYDFKTNSQESPFTYSIDNQKRVIITTSNSKERSPLSKEKVEAFTDKYNLLRSIKPTDYKGFSRSYMTALIFSYMSSDEFTTHKTTDEGHEISCVEDVLRTIKARQGQTAFRRDLLIEFNQRCAVTGCSIKSILEAAHIVPHREESNYHTGNGLLLRSDIHSLYDLNLIKINEAGSIILNDEVKSDKAYFEIIENKSIDSNLLTPTRKMQLKIRNSLKK